MSVNVYLADSPTHATVIVFHDSVQSSTLVRIEDEGEVTVTNNISHEALPGLLRELEVTLLDVEHRNENEYTVQTAIYTGNEL
jgi:cytochrome c biogenesis factor